MAEYCDSFTFSENNQDHYDMVPNDKDSYQFWQGLRGPYFTPSVDEDGVLSWTNNGQLPNPEPVRIVGKDGRGITLTGQCETVAELPEDPDQGEAWAVGTEEPFECYAWFGEWIDMGLLFPAGQDGVSPAVTITPTSTGHKVKITDRDHPSGQEFNVDDGDPGQDGVSPAVTITQTSTGHKVKITDKTHPAGQEFDVENGTPGAPGQGVPAGGSAGQYLKKASAADYDGEWDTLGAGDVAYDDSLTYESGTVGEELSAQKNTLNQLDAEKADEASLALRRSGATNTGEQIENGTYFYLDGTLTRAIATIATNADFTAQNCETVTAGGLNSIPQLIVYTASDAIVGSSSASESAEVNFSSAIPSGKTVRTVEMVMLRLVDSFEYKMPYNDNSGLVKTFVSYISKVNKKISYTNNTAWPSDKYRIRLYIWVE